VISLTLKQSETENLGQSYKKQQRDNQ